MGRRSKGKDPFGDLSLDDTFVRGAPVELSAEQREAKQRRERLQRELEEGQRVAARAKKQAAWRRQRRRLPVVLALLIVGSLLVWRQLSEEKDPSVPQAAGEAHADQLVFNGTVIERPPPSSEQAAAPLGRPVAVAAPSAQFRFREVQQGTALPVAYDPCRPIHLVVNARTAPAGADALVTEALKAITDATGLQIRVDGPSNEVPSESRLPYQAARYPGRWAPVLLAWSDPKETPKLEGDIAGRAGSDRVPVGDQLVNVTGMVVLDGPQLEKLLTTPDGRAVVRSVILHELAHLVGLDHVPDPTQLMNPEGSPEVVAFAAGDITGLAKLGQGACFPTV